MTTRRRSLSLSLAFARPLAMAFAGLAAAVAAAPPDTAPMASRAPLVLATCYQHRLPTDAVGLDRVSMRLAGLLRAQELPLVPVQLTDGFVASLGICDRRRNAAQAAQCRIYQMCSRLDAMDPDTRFLRPGAEALAAPATPMTVAAPVPVSLPGPSAPGSLGLPTRVGVAAP